MTRFRKEYAHPSVKRTAPCTPAGSITIEAAFAIPLFLFAAICLIYILEIHAIRTTVRMAAHTAAKQTAEQMAVMPATGTLLFRTRLLRAAGTERLERSIIVGGSGGIRCEESRVNDIGQLEVHVEYRVRLPFPEFAVPPMKCEESFMVKGWTGYERSGSSDDEADNEIVYITDTASVYHTDYQCTYLQLSIQFVSGGELELMRNESGSRYQVCEKCAGLASMGGYYITDYGNKYHTSLRCSGLKRTVYAVPKSEVEGRGGCSRCAQ